jgi:ribose transport system substrate-binding protein
MVFFIALAAVLLIGCSTKPPSDSSEKSSSGGKNDKQITVGFSISTLNNPFFVTLKEGAEKEAKAKGIKLVTVSAGDDPAKQINDIQDLIQKKVDVLLINPTDSDAVVTAVKAANDAGIPVITVDRQANGGEVATHIASDNVKGGQMAADFIKEKLGGKGNVVVLQGIPGSSAANERGKGFTEGIKGSGLKVVAEQPADFDRSKGLSVMENIIQSTKDFKAVFAQNDEMALGAISALKEAGLKDVVVVGFDGTDDGVAAVNNGEMAATIAQQPEVIGQLAIDNVEKAKNGEKLDDFIPVPLKIVKK